MTVQNRPLRVMHIISGDLWAGAEVQAFTLLQQLQAKVQLHVVVMNRGELLQRLEALAIPVTLVAEAELGSLEIIRRFIRLIRDFKPDILHTHRQKENIFGNIANRLANLFSGKPAKSLRTTHGAREFAAKGKQRIQVLLDNYTGRYLQQAVIAVSTELAAKLAPLFPAAKIHIIRNGVDSAALQAQAHIADFRTQSPGHKHVGIIGRIEPVKRIDIFLDAATLVISQIGAQQPLKFHVIGDGSLRAEMETKANAIGLAERIQFHGHRKDMASCIGSLDMIVMCSDHEGTPMTALEALALGIPLVAHNTGGLSDILLNYPHLLVADHSPAGYAQAIVANLMSDHGRPELPAVYSAEKNLEDTLRLYNSLRGR